MSFVRRLRRIHVHLPLAALALVLAQPSPRTNLAGTALVALGVLLRAWAAGVLDKAGGLCVDGPYRWVRHPLYLGSLVAALGFCVMIHVIWAWAVVLPLFLAAYAAQMLLEERLLREQFGQAYRDYARRVPMVLPWLASGGSAGRAWQWRRLLTNREHYHALVTFALVGLFYLKAYWSLR